MSEQQPFDVFLAHNNQDKPQIRKIYQALKQRGLNPWLDEEEIPPGSSFQDEIQQAIALVKTAAIFIGTQDLGRWQTWEQKAFFSQCVERNIKVIPVLLPGVTEIPSELIFLRELHAVTFGSGEIDDKGLFQLEWGITGKKPASRTNRKTQAEQVSQSSQSRNSSSTSASAQKTEPLDKRYANLDKYLQAQEWKKADKETYRLMITKVGKEDGDWFEISDIETYPCDDLRVINQLWVDHSDGLFGFSVQKQIWQECGSPKEYNQEWEDFGDRVGWRTKLGDWLAYDSLTPSLSSPKGNFPVVWWWFGLVYAHKSSFLSSLASRLVDCKL